MANQPTFEEKVEQLIENSDFCREMNLFGTKEENIRSLYQSFNQRDIEEFFEEMKKMITRWDENDIAWRLL